MKTWQDIWEELVEELKDPWLPEYAVVRRTEISCLFVNIDWMEKSNVFRMIGSQEWFQAFKTNHPDNYPFKDNDPMFSLIQVDDIPNSRVRVFWQTPKAFLPRWWDIWEEMKDSTIKQGWSTYRDKDIACAFLTKDWQLKNGNINWCRELYPRAWPFVADDDFDCVQLSEVPNADILVYYQTPKAISWTKLNPNLEKVHTQSYPSNVHFHCHLCKLTTMAEVGNSIYRATAHRMDALLCQGHFTQWAKEDRDGPGKFAHGYHWIKSKLELKARTQKADRECEALNPPEYKSTARRTPDLATGDTGGSSNLPHTSGNGLMQATRERMDKLVDEINDEARNILSKLNPEIRTFKDIAQDAASVIHADVFEVANQILEKRQMAAVISESIKQLAEKQKPLPKLLALAADVKFMTEEKQKELVKLIQEVRAAVQRTLSEWPRCKLCEEDWEIRELTVDADRIGIGHVCILGRDQGNPSYVHTKILNYVFSDDLKAKLKLYKLA